jgi:hypothetical protein
MRWGNSGRLLNDYGMPEMQRVCLTRLLVSNSPPLYFPPLTLTAEDLDKFLCTICTEEVLEGAGIVLVPCRHHEFCQSCIMEWLIHGRTCPLCRIRISWVVTPQNGYMRVRSVDGQGAEEESQELSEEHVEENEEDDLEENEEDDLEENEEDDLEEDEEEDESEEADENQQVRSTLPTIGVVRSEQEIIDESVSPTRMGDDRTHQDTPHTTGDLGHDRQDSTSDPSQTP